METTLDPTAQPSSMTIALTALRAAGVMGIERCGSCALRAPGWHIGAVEEVNFLAPFKFYRDEPRTVMVQPSSIPRGQSAGRLPIDRPRTLPTSQTARNHALHRASAVDQAGGEVSPLKPWHLSSESIIDAAEIYHIYSTDRVSGCGTAWWTESEWGRMAQDLLAITSLPIALRSWPAAYRTLLQMPAFGNGMHNRMGLPLHVEQVSCRARHSCRRALYP